MGLHKKLFLLAFTCALSCALGKTSHTGFIQKLVFCHITDIKNQTLIKQN